MYAATVRERPLTFQVSGMLWNRSLVMRDLETGSLWSHILGEAMQGKLAGESLRPVPSVLTDWRSWRADHPKTTVLALDRSARQFRSDFQKQPGTFVLGLAILGHTKAYPFDVLKNHPLINDTFRDVPVLITFDKKSTGARIFKRKLGERILSFQSGPGGTLADRETDSIWSPTTGRCTGGELNGSELDPLPGIVSFRRSWNTFHPDSEVFEDSMPSIVGRPIPERLTYKGIVINDPEMTTWGASPIKGEDGIHHLFAARWTSELGVDPGWRSHSEIAHFTSPSPTGPFTFRDVALAGTHQDGSWEKFAPHNPLIKKFGETFAIIYIARTDPKVNHTQRIGLATAKSLDGPWQRRDDPILDPSNDPGHWTHQSSCGVNNPAMVKMPDGRFFLYFKARKTGVSGTKMGLAIAEKLEGPYVIQPEPVTANKQTIEDGYAFLGKDGMVHLITTDNHGIIEKGGGLHWQSKDGLDFGAPTQAFHRLDHYIKRSDYPKARRIYGPGIWKCERPQLLVEDGIPRYLYAPSGISLDGDPATEAHIFEIKP